jgi:calreticulin
MLALYFIVPDFVIDLKSILFNYLYFILNLYFDLICLHNLFIFFNISHLCYFILIFPFFLLDKWSSRWVQSGAKKSEGQAGTLAYSAGEWYGDASLDKGIQTSQDSKYYFYTSKFDKPFSNAGKDLVLQYSVKNTQKVDCGGGYIKLLPASVDQSSFNGDSDYYIMFGPDVCGTSKRVHVIFNYKGKNYLIKREVQPPTDQLTHVYTLIVRPDQTYEILIDGVSKQTGKLEEDWDFLPAKKIKDPAVSKPKDWIDEPMMDDPSDKKPEDWDKTPKEIPNPEAEKPEDWDDETDGEWEPDTIPNPEWKGEWKPKKIANPEYKGKWVHPEIDNPEYKADPTIAQYSDIGAVGFDLWQVKSGTIFDNILVTDSEATANTFLEETYDATKDAEKKAFDEFEKTRAAKEEADRKKAEEERKKAEAASQEDEEEEKDEL